MNKNVELWKICRGLANKTRLRILRRLMCGAELCVLDIAKAEALSEVVASQHLRLLHEHGFLQLERKSKWVFYRSETPTKGSYAEYFFKIIRKKLLFGKDQRAELVHLFTAFTHPRRIDIAKALLRKDHTFNELISRCDISGQALYRHLNKLADRGFVVEKNKTYKIIREDAGLKKALLDACEAA